jgi:hypothetical protein
VLCFFWGEIVRVHYCWFFVLAVLFSGLFLVNQVQAQDVATSNPSPAAKPPSTFSTSSFWIESNSTISKLVFNNKTLELSFVASGQSGTVGYVKVRVLKTLLPDPDAAEVTIDGKKADYALKSNSNNWFIEFNYPHGEHQVKVSLASEASDSFFGISRLVWISSIVAGVFCLTVAVYLVIWLAKRKLPQQT